MEKEKFIVVHDIYGMEYMINLYHIVFISGESRVKHAEIKMNTVNTVLITRETYEEVLDLLMSF